MEEDLDRDWAAEQRAGYKRRGPLQVRPTLPQRARMIARRLYETGYDGMVPAEPHDALCDCADALSKGQEEIERLREALHACIPWVAVSARGAAQEALAVACDLLGSDPYDWSPHPDVLTARRELLGMADRRGE